MPLRPPTDGAVGVTGKSVDRAALLRRVNELYSVALRAIGDNRYAEAARVLRRTLRMLNQGRVADGLGGTNAVDEAMLRARMLVSLALAEAETVSLADGLTHLDAAGTLVVELPDSPAKMALEGLIRHQHGLLLYRAGQIDEGIALFDAAIVLTERAYADGAPESLRLTRLLVNRGLAHASAGHPSPASRDLRRGAALADAQRLDQLAAKAEHNLGDLAHLVGDVPGALRHYEEAGRRYRELLPGLLPRLRLDQARALLSAGLPEESAKHLDEVLPELRQQRSSRQDLAEAELYRAAAALLDADPATARKLATSARRRFLKRGSNTWATIASLTELRAATTAALDRNRIPSALPARALRLAVELESLNLEDEAAVARMLAVRMELRRGAIDTAAKLLDQVPSPRRITPVDHRMLLRLCRAELALATGNRRKALGQARAGLTELGRARDRMGGLELVSGTAVHGQELGELAVRHVLDGGGSPANASRLFSWLERTRAQVYRYEPLPPIDDPVLSERVAELRQLRRMVQTHRVQGRAVGDLLARSAGLEREAMRLGWQTSPWGRPRPVATLADVAGRLGDRVLVSFAASGQEMVAVVVANGRARLARLGRVADAAEAARELHADLDALAPDHLPEPLVAAVSMSAQRRAQRLDAQLLRPLARIIGDRELVVVPTGALYAVAWGVLPTLRGRPVVVAPSATAWLAASAGRPAEQQSRTRPTVLVRGPGLAAEVGEVRLLCEHHPQARLIEEEQATVGAVLAAMDGAGLAHLAAHGAHESANALFSRLELTDGALFAHETARLRQAPEHVVLAACELALSRIRAGDEALGFAGALLAAGVRTVTAAVSRVGDSSAAHAMADYHRRLAAGSSPATALAEATAVDPFRRPFICLGSG